MSAFFERPILNSPYLAPRKHWELDKDGHPTGEVVPKRRLARLVSPIPKPKKRGRDAGVQSELELGSDPSAPQNRLDPTPIINLVREKVQKWRELPDPNTWRVTPETARLLQHWRSYPFQGVRPFFCQVEAVEIAIWLTEVAPESGKEGEAILRHLQDANDEANPGLSRMALKLATGAGKTTVMAMLIAWQTINTVRRPTSKKFTKGFLVICPGLTIKDRLRVLQPNDPDSYYENRELIPADMLPDIRKAKIIITNYHAFKRRETLEVSSGTRQLLRGRGPELNTIETEGQMLHRVMPELLGMKQVMVLNDEAHHCYREKPITEDEDYADADEKREAEKNKAAARLWISGIEALARKITVLRVMDLSATPFFLRGSGYREGELFHWTVSDFSLMDAIECGIVKLPRVPVADNIPHGEYPVYRNLWENIRKDMPKAGRGKAKGLDPNSLPAKLETALQSLYNHYVQVYEAWEKADMEVPPCFIVVCNNTSTSKLVFDYISGFIRETEDGSGQVVNGRLALFRNFDENGRPFARPRTLLIDSEQLESGEALDKDFRTMAATEIEQFRNEIIQRTGSREQADNLKDEDLLREVMNTVGRKGRLGESIRCVVSVSMLTEGWDTNTVTHILGVRAFGTQLLCEQVIGRALRRKEYLLNNEGLFDVEYADVLGIPFDFNAQPVVAPPVKPIKTVRVHAVRPDRDRLEITFPRVQGYRVEQPKTILRANFTDESRFELTPAMTGPTQTENQGILGESVKLAPEQLVNIRPATVAYRLTQRLIEKHWKDTDEPPLHLFGQLKNIVTQWLENDYLVLKGQTFQAQVLYNEISDQVCDRITAAITRAHQDEAGTRIKVILDPYNPVGSTRHVNFNTSAPVYATNPNRCHLNYLVYDSGWESEFMRVVEGNPHVVAYVKNHALGFEVPYPLGTLAKMYRPDFIVLVDDGRGKDDLLNLVVEIKGYRGEDAKQKKDTINTYWGPGVTNSQRFGRWAFVEFTDGLEIQKDFEFVVAEARKKNQKLLVQ